MKLRRGEKIVSAWRVLCIMQSMRDKDGGPANPGPIYVMCAPQQDPVAQGGFLDALSRSIRDAPGVSMRDYFAAAALTGLVGRPEPENPNDKGTAEDYAECAYAYADAMLAERSK